jgi:hypothetical protein
VGNPDKQKNLKKRGGYLLSKEAQKLEKERRKLTTRVRRLARWQVGDTAPESSDRGRIFLMFVRNSTRINLASQDLIS